MGTFEKKKFEGRSFGKTSSPDFSPYCLIIYTLTFEKDTSGKKGRANVTGEKLNSGICPRENPLDRVIFTFWG